MVETREALWALQDKAYQDFSAKLLPGVSNIIGVRLPELRKLAKQYAKADWCTYLSTAKDDYFEETMLQGMVIGYADMTLEERFTAIQNFVPKINNWSVCDTFCSGLKFSQKQQQAVWDFLQPYFQQENPFAKRFGVVMLLNYFITDDWIHQTLQQLVQVRSQNYYVRMALGWAFSIAYIHFPEETLPWLEETKLDAEVLKKSLQKIIESNRIHLEQKDFFRKKKQLLATCKSGFKTEGEG